MLIAGLWLLGDSALGSAGCSGDSEAAAVAALGSATRGRRSLGLGPKSCVSPARAGINWEGGGLWSWVLAGQGVAALCPRRDAGSRYLIKSGQVTVLEAALSCAQTALIPGD